MKVIKVNKKEDCKEWLMGPGEGDRDFCGLKPNGRYCTGPDSDECPLEPLEGEGGEMCLWPNGVPGFPAHRLPKCHPSYRPLKCTNCKKEIDEDNCVAVTKKGKTKYYCSGIRWGNAIDASSH